MFITFVNAEGRLPALEFSTFLHIFCRDEKETPRRYVPCCKTTFQGETPMKKLIAVVFGLAALTMVAMGMENSGTEPRQDTGLRERAEAGKDTTLEEGWSVDAVTSASLSQVSFQNWVQGGENSLSYVASAISNASHLAQQTQWSNFLKLSFGQARLGDNGLRKTDDEIYFESLLVYLVWEEINPYGAVTLRTQFAPGYQYPENQDRIQVSTFFDPAYLTQAVGMKWDPASLVTVRLGVGARQVVTSQFPEYADDPETPEVENVRFDSGLESVVTFAWNFAENMLLASRLELFSAFNHLDRVIVRNDNVVSAKVNDLISVNFNVQFVNDVNVSPKTQIKQTFALGFSYTVL
jgi:hypothetical protein